MIATLTEKFAQLHQWVFESAVLPLLYETGFGGFAEPAFDATEIFLIGVIEIAFLAIVLGALEKWRPVQPQNTNVAKRHRRTDILYTLLNRLGFLPLLMFFALLPFITLIDSNLRLHDIIPPKLEDWLPWLNAQPLVSFFAYLVILDFVAYWLHRGQHQFHWWWSLHALHHSQQTMSFWSDDRNHLLDDLLMDGAFALVALLIGVPPAQFVAVVLASRAIESLSHANLRLYFGRVGEYLLVSPRFHRVHHAIGLGHEGRAQGCNFAVLLPVWDVMFGTANLERVFPPTGIRDQLDGRDYGETFLSQQWLGIKRLVGKA